MFFLSCFLFNKIGEKENRTGSAWKKVWEVAQTMYTHVSKCKNDKIFKSKSEYTVAGVKSPNRPWMWLKW
jgi:hypothetical protein